MGNCVSCLGAGGRESGDEDDETRLLFEDPNQTQYGGFGEASIGRQEDAQEAQREAEALQQVVASTSDSLVDVFDVAKSEQHNTFDSTQQPNRALSRDQDDTTRDTTSEASASRAGPRADNNGYRLDQEDESRVSALLSLTGNFKQAAAAMT